MPAPFSLCQPVTLVEKVAVAGNSKEGFITGKYTTSVAAVMAANAASTTMARRMLGDNRN